MQLTELYRNSLVGDSFERLEIEAFSKGSILVDYYVSFKEFEGQVTTSVIKEVLNQQFEGQDGSSKLGRFTIDPMFTDFYGKTQTFLKSGFMIVNKFLFSSRPERIFCTSN